MLTQICSLPISIFSQTAMEPLNEPTCRLWSLPQELIDEIFSPAFPADPDMKLVSQLGWTQDEEYKQRVDRTNPMKPFPPLKINSFLVSKQFFLAAASAYSKNQQWHESFENSNLVQEFPLLLHSAHSLAFRPSIFHPLSELEALPRIRKSP